MARILIVDDSEDTRMMLGNFLSHAGHETVFAANGWEALLTLEHANVDLILLDLMMPGMDGQTFLRILRQGQKKANLPVVIVSALDYGSEAAGLGRLGVESYLMKNEDMFNRLLTVVEGAVGKSEKSRADSLNRN